MPHYKICNSLTSSIIWTYINIIIVSRRKSCKYFYKFLFLSQILGKIFGIFWFNPKQRDGLLCFPVPVPNCEKAGYVFLFPILREHKTLEGSIHHLYKAHAQSEMNNFCPPFTGLRGPLQRALKEIRRFLIFDIKLPLHKASMRGPTKEFKWKFIKIYAVQSEFDEDH